MLSCGPEKCYVDEVVGSPRVIKGVFEGYFKFHRYISCAVVHVVLLDMART